MNIDWSTQIAAGLHINGQQLIDMPAWCDWCGLDMKKQQTVEISGRILKVHKRCQNKTINHYKL